MTIKIEITGNDPTEIAQNLLALGGLVSGALKPRAPQMEDAAPEQKDEAPKAETKRTRKAKADDKPADEQKELAKDEADSAAETVENSEAENTTEAAEEPAMSIDDLRKYTVTYLAERHPGKLDDQKNEFKELLDKFSVDKIGALPADKINAFKAMVDERKAEASK